MYKSLLFASVAVVCFTSPALAQKTPYDLVDPLVGTGGEGHTYPRGVAPFGMVQLSPDTNIAPFKQSYKWAAGYRYGDKVILVFPIPTFPGRGIPLSATFSSCRLVAMR